MDYKNYLTKSNILIFVCVIIILLLILFIGHNLVGAYNNTTLSSDTKLTASSICGSLIVALISVIAIVINTDLTKKSIEQTNENIEENRIHNQKTINQTNELIEQNEENRYIQLRFENVQKSLIKLSHELQLTIVVYDELKKLNSEKLLFNPRGFILMQYVNLIENNELLDYVPLKLRVDFDSRFIKRINQNIIDDVVDDYVREINSYNRCNYDNIVQENLKNNLEFEDVVNKFNKNCSSNYFIQKFKSYYSSDIDGDELEKHMEDIIQEIEINKPEKHILDEKYLEILKA